jgi:hypothetical protein
MKVKPTIAIATTITTAVVAIVAAVTLGSGSLATTPNRGGAAQRFAFPASQWTNGRWQRQGQYELEPGQVALPYVGHLPTRPLSYMDLVAPAGLIFDLRYTTSPLREYLYRYARSGAVAQRTPIAPDIPLSCTPNVILATPLVVACSYHQSGVYLIEGGTTWRVPVPVSVKGVASAQVSSDGVVTILFCAAESPTSVIKITEVSLQSRTIKSIESSNVRVLNSSRGGGVGAAPGPNDGWLIESNTDASSSTRCDELSSYDDHLRLRWSQYFGGNCSQLLPANPVVSGDRVFFALSGELTQYLFSLGPSGGRQWTSKVITGVQDGYAAAPILGSNAHGLCVSGFGDGVFVGEHLNAGAYVDYAYSARVNVNTGVIAWKARMVTQVASYGSSHWALYEPTTMTCTPTQMQVLDTREYGSVVPSYPIMLLMTSVKS